LIEGLTLLEREKRLGEHLKELSEIRSNRLMKLKQLKDEEDKLCKMLTEKPCDVDAATVPSAQQLADIQENILRLESEKVCDADSVYMLSCLYYKPKGLD